MKRGESCKDHKFHSLLFTLANGHVEFVGGKVLFRVYGAFVYLVYLLIPSYGSVEARGEVVWSKTPQHWRISSDTQNMHLT